MTIFQLFVIVSQVIAGMIADGYVPIDTGNMAYNAIVYRIVGGNEIHVYVDNRIASYAKYTEGPWVAQRWHDKKNPNEGWWADRFIEELIKRIAQRVSGEIT